MRISACLIVKNEERNIGRCINSFKDVVDEIILVDTGSTDNTVKIARELGAEIYNFKWDGDFSHARNYALGKARYRWILFLDADEYFINGTEKNIKSIIERIDSDSNIDAIRCKIISINSVNSHAINSASAIRIFRNTSFNRYHNAIHESIRYKKLFFSEDTDLVLEHTGYSPDIVKDKLNRNLGPLLEMLEKGNKNLAYFYLVDSYAGFGDFEEAIKYAKLFIDSGLEIIAFKSKVPQVMISCMMRAGYNKESILREINKWSGKFPGHPAFANLAAKVYFEQKRYNSALDNYKKALEYRNAYKAGEYVMNMDPADRLYYVIGWIYELKNDYNAALEYYVNSLKYNKENEPALVRLIGIIKKESGEDIIYFLNGIYDKNNKDDIELLVKTLSKLRLGKVFLYYQNIWQNVFDNVDNTLMFALLSNGKYESAFKYFYQCYCEEKSDWTGKFTVISAILSGNNENINKIRCQVAPFYQKILDSIFGSSHDIELDEDEIKEYLNLLYEFILLSGNSDQVDNLIGLKNKFKFDISSAIGDLLKESGVYDLAIEQYEDYLKAGDPEGKTVSEIYFKIGYCCYKLYDYNNALNAFKESILQGYKDYDIIEYLNWIKECSNNNEINRQVELLLENISINEQRRIVPKPIDGSEVIKRIEYLKNLLGDSLNIDMQRAGNSLYVPEGKVINQYEIQKTILLVFSSGVENELYKDETNKLVQALINREYSIVVLPYKNDDIEQCALFAGKFESPYISAINSVPGLEEITYIIQKSCLCISMEESINVLSLASGRPFISLRYSEKLEKLAENTGLKSMITSKDKVNASCLMNKITYVNENYEDITIKIDRMFEGPDNEYSGMETGSQYITSIMPRKKILYLGWLGYGNVGDELLLEVFKKLFYMRAGELAFETSIDAFAPQKIRDIDLHKYEIVVLGGGSLLTLDYWEDICIKANQIKVPVVIWGTGIDIRDSKQINDIINAFENNCSISLKRNKTIDVVKLARLAGVRGKVDKYLIGNDNVSVIGDPGIVWNRLFTIDNNLLGIDDFIGQDDKKIVLVNWGTSYNNISGKNEENVQYHLKTAMIDLINRGYKIIIYPIWREDIDACRILSGSFDKNSVFLIDKVYDTCKLSGIIDKCLFSINLKLHANILSMSLCKPFVSLAYGLKCYDFAESIGYPNLVVNTDKITGKIIIDKMEYIVKNYDSIQKNFNDSISDCYNKQISFMDRIICKLMQLE